MSKRLVYAYWYREDGTYAWSALGLVDSREDWWDWAKENLEEIEERLNEDDITITTRLVNNGLPEMEPENE